MGGEVFDETVLGDTTSLFETRHALPNLHVHKTVVLNTCEIIFAYNLIRDECDGNAHVFIGGEGGAVIKFCNVDGAEAGGGGADCAVEEAFDGGDGGAGGRCIAGVVETITASSDPHAILFFFERPEGCNKTGVGDFAALGDSAGGNEENGVGARDATADSLGEEAQVVRECPYPDCRVRAAGEGAVFVWIAGDRVEDGIGLVG